MITQQSVTSCSDCALGAAGGCPMVTRRVTAGTTLWTQGDIAPELVFVKDGLMSVSATEPSAVESVTAVRGPRSMLGASSLRGQASPTTVVALTDVTVCAAPPHTVQRWMGGPTPAAALLGLTLDELNRQARDFHFRTGPSLARVARFLLEFATLIEGGRRAPFSKQHVAQLLGMRAETLSRCLRQLVEEGLIESGRRVVVKDAAKLSELARGSE